MLSPRNLLAALLGLITAVACIQLGRWQLRRLAERRQKNALVMARLAAPPVDVGALSSAAGGGARRFRRVRVSGRFDFDHEIALVGRTRQGAPGVNIITPLRMEGGEGAVLVNRGWVYSPDAFSVELARWQEPERATIDGYIEELSSPSARSDRPRLAARSWRALDRGMASSLPYRAPPYVVVALSPPRAGASAPQRLAPPPLDEGSHRGYAVQWFSFALIALVGAGILIQQDLQRQRRDAIRP